MLQTPLFEPNIFATLVRNISFYLNDGYWGYVFSGIMLLVLAQLLWLKPRPGLNISELSFPRETFSFSRKSRSDIGALCFFLLCFGIGTAVLYSLDMTLFNNFDLMNVGTTVTFEEGKGTGISDIRFSPLANVELNLFYAVSRHLAVVTAFTLAETALLLFLLYRLFAFIPVPARLVALGIVMLSPSFLWLNNPVYPERLMLLFICGSFLALRKYFETSLARHFFLFVVLLNLALYTKETVILFYTGFLAAAVLCLIYAGKLVPVSFLHPVATARKFPAEFMMFFSMLVFALVYLLFGVGFADNEYIVSHSIHDAWKNYWLEFLLWILAAVCLAAAKKKNIFMAGLLTGSLVVLAAISWWLKIANGLYASYYAVIAAVFSIMILAYACRRPSAGIMLAVLVLCFSGYQNIKIYRMQNGAYYRQTAEFLSEHKFGSRTVHLYVKDSVNGLYEGYVADCYRSAYKYYFPAQHLVFKTGAKDSDRTGDLLKHTLIYQAEPQPGDVYIENRFHSRPHPENYRLIYENRLFRVFDID